jgi:hypothetical protein
VPRATSRTHEPALQAGQRKVRTSRPHQRFHVEFRAVNAFAVPVHAVLLPAGATAVTHQPLECASLKVSTVIPLTSEGNVHYLFCFSEKARGNWERRARRHGFGGKMLWSIASDRTSHGQIAVYESGQGSPLW